ncbi:MAG: DUF1194 domain-containing protein [Tagaea sp.]
MKRRTLLGTGLAAGLAFAAAPARAAESADVAVALAIDSSSSVSMDEYYLQMEGYAAAFRHPAVAEAISTGRVGAAAVAMFEFSDAKTHTMNLEWRRLASPADLEAYAKECEIAPRLVVGGATAIGDAIDFAHEALDACPFPAARRVIDVSGDGASNQGRNVLAARADALAAGIAINGLPILNEEPALDVYFRLFVIGGPGAFVIPARDYTDFREAIRDKLVREIRYVS